MTRKALILSAGIVASLTGAALAQTYDKEWDGSQSTSWAEPQNWTPAGVPSATDDVGIVAGAPNNPIYDESTNTTIQSLAVEAGRELTFAASKTLTVTGALAVRSNAVININGASAVLVASGADALDIDPASGIGSSPGRIRVNAGSAVLRLSGASSAGNVIDGEILLLNATGKLDITANVKVTGNGMIRGEDPDAQISIGSGNTFTSTMGAASGGIRGFMKINGNGTFVSQGRVEANGGTLELVAGLAAVNDNSSAIWAVASAQNSRLLFSRSATTLQGDFVTASELELGDEVDVWTCGELSYNAGSIIDLDAANSKSFRYLTFGSSSCANPSDGTTAGCSDNTVFTVNTDKLTPCS